MNSRDESFREATRAFHVQKNPYDCLKLLRRAADKGHAEAGYQAGMQLHLGADRNHSARDGAAAVRYLELAANAGHEVITPSLLEAIRPFILQNEGSFGEPSFVPAVINPEDAFMCTAAAKFKELDKVNMYKSE